MKMKTFVNTRLGRPWLETGIEISEADLMSRRRNVAAVPKECDFILAAVDVQRGRGQGENGWLSVLVTAWSTDEKTHVIDRMEFTGDTSVISGAAWTKLKEWLQTNPAWHREDGVVMGLTALMVDSSDQTDTVYESLPLLQSIIGNRAFLIKGSSVMDKPIAPPKVSRGKYGTPFFSIGVEQAKHTLMHRMHEDGRITYEPTLPKEVFSELSSERLTPTRYRGRIIYKFKQIEGKANEAWDCLVYCLAGFRLLNLNNVRKTKKKEEKQQDKEVQTAKPTVPETKSELKSELSNKEEDSSANVIVEEPPPAKPKRRPKRRVFKF